MLFDGKGRYVSQWTAIESISAEIDRPAKTQRSKTNRILKLTSACFAQVELDRQLSR
jgi:hypothetical protein